MGVVGGGVGALGLVAGAGVSRGVFRGVLETQLWLTLLGVVRSSSGCGALGAGSYEGAGRSAQGRTPPSGTMGSSTPLTRHSMASR